jgi:signal transduction histidine kinase
VTVGRSYFQGVLLRLLALTALPCLVFPAFFLWNGYHNGEALLAERATLIQRSLGESAREGLLTGQVDQYLAPLAQSVLLQPEAVAVVFRDEKGNPIFSMARKPGTQKLFERFVPPDPTWQGPVRLGAERYLVSAGPVVTWRMVGEEQMFGLAPLRTQATLGSVEVFLSRNPLLEELKRDLLLSLLAAFLVLGLCVLAAVSLTRRVTSPIYQLIRAFREFEGGNYSPAMPEPRERELAKLVDQFKSSAARFGDLIKEKDSFGAQLLATAQELEDLNENLETKIAERTQSLQNAVQMLELTNRKIQEADRLKSEFLANMSHELRTPLNAVIGFSELLLERIPGPITLDQEQCLEDVLQAGQHLLKLINEILDLSKVEAGKMTLNFTTAPAEALIHDVQNLFRPLLAKKNQELEVICPAPSTPLYTDQNKLKQVVINLLSNAHKFSPEGSTIRLSLESRPNRHTISVRDEGIGIPEAQQDHIFEAFRQLDGTMSRTQEGTGLGLTLCRRFTELLGGGITVKSAVGAGATFTVALPADPSHPLDSSEFEEGRHGSSACG